MRTTLQISGPDVKVCLDYDISVRARVAVRNDGVEVEGGRLESMVLKVMEGSVEDVVVSLMWFGGGSGAALPSTHWVFELEMPTEQLKIEAHTEEELNELYQ
eukprot:scaffold156739_cov23-Cyclotella_meneghiniana.AAC.2